MEPRYVRIESLVRNLSEENRKEIPKINRIWTKKLPVKIRERNPTMRVLRIQCKSLLNAQNEILEQHIVLGPFMFFYPDFILILS